MIFGFILTILIICAIINQIIIWEKLPMTVNEYLTGILVKRSNNGAYTQAEEQAYSRITLLINKWAGTIKVSNGWYGYMNALSIEAQKSGSRAKGTAIKGKSDIDIFVSITDRNGQYAIKDLYNNLYDFLRKELAATIPMRKQNVSIGIDYAGCSIDITPAKKYNGSYYTSNGRRFDDHWIYSRKSDSRTLTNIQKHIELVRNSGLAKEIMLLKIWRNQNNLELPSIYLEIFAREVLSSSYFGLESNFITLLTAIRDTVLTRKIVDPSNTTNIISADSNISQSEKQQAKHAAEKSLTLIRDDWRKVIW